jgi:hemolysin III
VNNLSLAAHLHTQASKMFWLKGGFFMKTFTAAAKKIKDPGSAFTHFIAMVLAIFAAAPLLLKGSHTSLHLHTFSLAVFILSMIGLYAASTIYHSLDISPAVNKLLRKIDHMMIFILIAGTYTPVCLIVLGDRTGWLLLGLVWSIAIVGIIINALWITCPKWFSSLIYIAMGWVCVLAFTKIINALTTAAFSWLLAGGIIYTVGGIIYALKLPILSRFPYFGSHELFHLFVMGGSLCHYVMMYCFVA